MIPIVFTHRVGVKAGDQKYLGYAIRQAQQYNPRVILVGDMAYASLEVEFYEYARYAQGGELFEAHYVHMCTNPREFEVYHMRRHFMLRQFMEAQGLEKMFLCDSDVMVYCDIAEAESTLGDYDVACSFSEEQWPYRWSASPHVSYWSRGTCAEFCDYMWRTYTTPRMFAHLKEKWDWHQRTGTMGGVCDMTLLWLFAQDRKAINLAQVRDGATFDKNMNTSENWALDEYRMKDGFKEIAWRHNQPYGFNLKRGEWIRFNTLHFQGGERRKRLLWDYARGRYDNS